MNTSKLIVILLISFVISSCGFIKNGKVVYEDYRASVLVSEKKYDEALEKYYIILQDQPNKPSVHSNVGIILNLEEKPKDAIKSLRLSVELAKKNGSRKEQFAAYYNLGVLLGAERKYIEAIESYQEALNRAPTSVEVKTNIELLRQKQKQQQEQDQKDKEQQEQKDKENSDKDNEKNEDQKNESDKQDPDKESDNKKDKDPKKDEKPSKEDESPKNDNKPQSSPKYQPRPFKGDQLSEGDVKKILGELKNQEQKIRSKFDKKESGADNANEKDW